MDNARSIIKQRNYAVNYFIDGYFSEIKSVVDLLADNEMVRNGAQLNTAELSKLKETYRKIAARHKYVSYLYSGYETSNELIINDFTTPDDYDPKERPWYQAAINAQPDISTGLPYHEIVTNEWLLSTSKVLYSQERNNKMTGVVASDSSIDIIMTQLSEQNEIYKSSYSYVIDPNGTIILHPNQDLLGKNISTQSEAKINFDVKEGYIRYELDGKKKIAYFSHAQEAKWLIVTLVEEAEIIQALLYKICIYILIVMLMVTFLGFALSHLLSNKFSAPLVQLKDKVKGVVHGDEQSHQATTYPNNEIGIIAREIEKLTTDELYAKSQELQKLNHLLAQKALKDPLTRLYNRYKIEDELANLYQELSRYNKPFSIILLDIDGFKRINDTYGHQMGDTTLKELALLLQKGVRNLDCVGRWGGEEFLIICPNLNLIEVKSMARRIRENIEAFPFSVKIRVTASFGVAECSRNESIDNLITRVDKNLYYAKEKGKNQVV